MGWVDFVVLVFNVFILQFGFEQELMGFDFDVLMWFVFWGYIYFYIGFVLFGLIIDYGVLCVGVDIDVNFDGYLFVNLFSLIEFDGNQFLFLNGVYLIVNVLYVNDYVLVWVIVLNFDV